MNQPNVCGTVMGRQARFYSASKYHCYDDDYNNIISGIRAVL